MSDDRLSHPYRTIAVIVERMEARRVISRDALDGELADLDKLASELDLAARLVARAKLNELVGKLRRERRRYVEARHTAQIARWVFAAVASSGTGAAVIAAIVHQPLAWVLVAPFLALMALVAYAARGTMRVDEVIAAHDRIITRLERVIDSQREDDPLSVIQSQTKTLESAVARLRDEGEQERAARAAEIAALEAQQRAIDARQGKIDAKVAETRAALVVAVEQHGGVRVDTRDNGGGEDVVDSDPSDPERRERRRGP